MSPFLPPHSSLIMSISISLTLLLNMGPCSEARLPTISAHGPAQLSCPRHRSLKRCGPVGPEGCRPARRRESLWRQLRWRRARAMTAKVPRHDGEEAALTRYILGCCAAASGVYCRIWARTSSFLRSRTPWNACKSLLIPLSPSPPPSHLDVEEWFLGELLIKCPLAS